MSEEIIDEVVGYHLPQLDQGSKRHTRGVLATLCRNQGVDAKGEEIMASIHRLGFRWVKERGYRRSRWVRPPDPQAPVA